MRRFVPAGLTAAFVALVLAFGGLPISPVTAAADAPATPVHYFGIVRNLSGTWALIDDANHTPVGFDTTAPPTCWTSGPNAGWLEVRFTAAVEVVGVAIVTPDDAYVGAIEVGASVGLAQVWLRFRGPTGTAIPCSDNAKLAVNGSNVFIDFWGWLPNPTPPPTASPSTALLNGRLPEQPSAGSTPSSPLPA